MPDPVLPGARRPEAPTRRDFLRTTVAFGAGALALPVLPPRTARRSPPADAVIQIFLQGGLSHIDTFDPKPDAPVDVRSSFRPVATAVEGLQFTDLCRRTADVADRLVVLRAVTHTEAAHERGTSNMLTGYRPSPAIHYPGFGAVVAHELGPRSDLPSYVCIPDARIPDLGTGYLSSAYGPFSVGGEPVERDFEVRDLTPPKGVADERLARRRRMLEELDGGYSTRADAVVATEAFYEQAFRLVDSEAAREAFAIAEEPDRVRDAYGRTRFGQRLLLARRLVAAGARCVVVTASGFDHHDEVARGLRARMPEVDRGFAALIADLESTGLLDRTLVLLTTEFGRTPKLNRDRGRDHWPRAFTVLAAGGGLKRGVVLGATDASGAEPEDAPVTPADLAATWFTQLGIDPTRRLMSPGDRPIDIVRGGRVLREIVA